MLAQAAERSPDSSTGSRFHVPSSKLRNLSTIDRKVERQTFTRILALQQSEKPAYTRSSSNYPATLANRGSFATRNKPRGLGGNSSKHDKERNSFREMPEIGGAVLRKIPVENVPEGTIRWNDELLHVESNLSLHFKNSNVKTEFGIIVAADEA